MKRIITTLLFVTLLAAPKVPVLADTDSNTIQEILTSAIDGSLFVAHFNPDDNKVSFVDMEGESMGYRYVDSEEEFWELVEINTEVTNQSIEERIEIARDQNNEEFLRSGGERVSSRFDTGIVNMRVPQRDTPQFGGWWVDVGFFKDTQSHHRQLNLWTYEFPSGMRTIDVFFSNLIGDDISLGWNIPPWSTISHPIRFPGEPYNAAVSSSQGSFNNVRLRFFAM